MLIPLFGFHYVVFIGLSAFMNVNRVLELIWLFGDQLFASFQVSALCSGELKTWCVETVANMSGLRQPVQIIYKGMILYIDDI